MTRFVFIAILCVYTLTSCAQGKSLPTKNKKALRYFQQAEQSYTYGSVLESLEYLKLATEEDPKFIDAHNMQGIIHMSQALVEPRNGILLLERPPCFGER